MLGSLDNPPIVVRSDRRKSSFFLATFLAPLAFFVHRLIMGSRDWGDWFLTGSLCWISVVVIFRLVIPDTLYISGKGITYKSQWILREFEWKDITHIFASGVSGSFVGLNYTDNYNKYVFMRKINSFLGGAEGCLYGGWEVDVKPLCELLNQARDRWGSAGG